MKCPKCGSPLPDNARFCGVCGCQLYPQQGAPVQPNHAPAQPQPQQPPQQPPQRPQQQYMPAQGQPYYNPAAYAGAAAMEQPKKSKKGIIAICIVVAVLAALAVLIVSLRSVIARSVMGELGYYALTEVETIGTIVENEEFDGLFSTDELTFDANGTVTAEEEEFAGKIAAKGSYSTEEKKATAKITLTEVTSNESIDYIVNAGNGKLGVEFNGETMVVPFMSNNLNTEEFSTLATKLYPIIKKAESEHLAGGITTSKEEIDGKKYRVTTFTVKLSDFDLALADVLEEVQNDEEIMASIKKLLNDNAALISTLSDDYEGMSADEIYNDFKESLPELIKQLRTTASKLVEYNSNSMLTYKVVYKNGSQILQRQLTLDNTTMTLKTIIAGETSTVTYTQDEDTHFDYVVTKNRGKTTAQLNGMFDGESVNVTATDMETENINDVKVAVGTINFQVADVASGVITLTADTQYHISGEYAYGAGKAVLKLDLDLDDDADLSEYKEPQESAGSTSKFSDFFDM